MLSTPGMLGAMAAVLVAGVAGGAVIGSVPPMRQMARSDYFPQAAGQFAQPAVVAQALPDQYPIDTPEGRFEVSELSIRGLYSNARYDRAYYDPEPNEPVYRDAEPVAPDQPAAAPQADGGDAAASETPAEPVAPEAGAAPVVVSAGPRIVDVAGELAARQ